MKLFTSLNKIIATRVKSLKMHHKEMLLQMSYAADEHQHSMGVIYEIIQRQGFDQGLVMAQSRIESLKTVLTQNLSDYFNTMDYFRRTTHKNIPPIPRPTKATCAQLVDIIIETAIRFHQDEIEFIKAIQNDPDDVKPNPVSSDAPSPMFSLNTYADKIRYAHRYPSLLYLLRKALRARLTSGDLPENSPLKPFLNRVNTIPDENTPESWAQYLRCYTTPQDMEAILAEYGRILTEDSQSDMLLPEEKFLFDRIDSIKTSFAANDQLFHAFAPTTEQEDLLKKGVEQFCQQCQTQDTSAAGEFLSTAIQKSSQTETLQDLIYHFKSFFQIFIPKPALSMLKNGYRLGSPTETDQADTAFIAIQEKAFTTSDPEKEFHFIRLGYLEEYQQRKTAKQFALDSPLFHWIPFESTPIKPMSLNKMEKTLLRCIRNDKKRETLEKDLAQLKQNPKAFKQLFDFIRTHNLFIKPKYIVMLAHTTSLSLYWQTKNIPQVLKDQLNLTWVLNHTKSVLDIRFNKNEDAFKIVENFIRQYEQLRKDSDLKYTPRHSVIWQWCRFHVDNSMRELLKEMIDPHTRNKLTNIKVVSIILNVLLDDLADNFQDEEAFEALETCLLQTPRLRKFLKSGSPFNLEKFIAEVKKANQAHIAQKIQEHPELQRFKNYFDLALQLWAKNLELLISTVEPDNFAALEKQYYTDYGRMICSMYYSIRMSQRRFDFNDPRLSIEDHFLIPQLSRFLNWNMNMGQFGTGDDMETRRRNRTAYENFRHGNKTSNPEDYRPLLRDETVARLKGLLPTALHPFLRLDPSSKNFQKHFGSSDYWNHRIEFLLKEQHMGQDGNDVATCNRELDAGDFSNSIFLITMEKIPATIYAFLLLGLSKNKNTKSTAMLKDQISSAILTIEAETALLQEWFQKYQEIEQSAKNPAYQEMNARYRPDKTLQQVVEATASYLIFKGRL